MTERSVTVRLMADVSDFRAKMLEAEKMAKALGPASEQSVKRADTAMGRLAQHAKKNEQAWTETGKVLLGFGVAAGVGVGAAVKTFADFDKQMSAVQAATLASEKEMEGLGAAAIKAGQDTAYSASEAAGGIEQLAKAGVSTADIMGGGLSGSLALAAAGELEVADAAEIAASTMVQFNLEGNEVGKVADALAAGANKAQGSVQDLGLALSYAGVPAAALGLSVEETTGVLGLFANAGIVGEKAGTALRSMLVSLQNPSEKAAGTMSDLGINVFDAQGNFIGMEATAGVLADKMGGLDQQTRGAALATIFGNEALGAATSLYNGGSSAVSEWTAAVSESGYAAEVAATRLDNLSGDVQILRGSMETALIGLGEAGSGPLRDVTQDLTTLVNEFSSLDDGIQSSLLTAGAITGAVGLAGGAFFLATPKILAANASLALMGPAGARAAAGLSAAAGAAGRMGPAIAVLTVVGAAATSQWLDQKQAVDEYAASLDQTTGAVSRATREVAAKVLVDEDAYELGRQLGLSQQVVTDAALGEADAMAKVADATRRAKDSQVEGTQKAGDWSRALQGNAFDGENTAIIADRLNGILYTQGSRLDDARSQWADYSAGVEGSSRVTDDARAALFGLSGQTEAFGILSAEAAVEQQAFAAGIAGVGDASDSATGYVRLLGDVTGQTQEQVDAATEAIDSWHESLAGTRDAFVEPLAVYTGLLDEKTAAEQASAQATADSTEDASDSWEDYVTDVGVSMDEYTERQLQRIVEQDAFEANILEITRRGRADVARELIAKGEEGVALAAEFAAAETAEFNAGADAMIAATERGTAGSAAELDTGLRVMEESARRGANNTAEAIAEELGIGVDEVERIAAQYGIALAEGVNPLLDSLGRPKVSLGRRRTGPTDTYLADGGVLESHLAHIAPAGTWRTFAEPETAGEALLPLRRARVAYPLTTTARSAAA